MTFRTTSQVNPACCFACLLILTFAERLKNSHSAIHFSHSEGFTLPAVKPVVSLLHQTKQSN